MIVVSNTTPLIGLAVLGRFQLLEQLFGEIHIPGAVYVESVVAGRAEGGAKREALPQSGSKPTRSGTVWQSRFCLTS
jgi:predicted nucleic acid-binding protein